VKNVERKQGRGTRKKFGAFYTPEYIVRYIVANTVGKQIAGKSPEQIAEMRFADISCGAGAFLLGTYEAVLDYVTGYYNEPCNYQAGIAAGCVEKPDNTLRLSFEQKKQILLNNIYGVDLDPQAVEFTKLALYLRLIDGEEGVGDHAGLAWEIATRADEFATSVEIPAKIFEAVGLLQRFVMVEAQ
jgi:adenine-specific DNA-methyltransferase